MGKNTFSGLNGTYGGAVFIHIDLNYKALYLSTISYSISGLEITDCHASKDGGALFLRNVKQMELKDSLIANNRAENMGGGVYFECYESVSDQCVLALDNTRVTANHALIGGGIRWNWRKPVSDYSSLVSENIG